MKTLLIFGAAAFLAAPAAFPQDAQKATVAFSDPSQPRKLVVDTMFGSVTVRGYGGQEAVVETTGRTGIRASGRKETEPPAGMHRIGGNNPGIEITEENNTVSVSGGASPFPMPTWSFRFRRRRRCQRKPLPEVRSPSRISPAKSKPII